MNILRVIGIIIGALILAVLAFKVLAFVAWLATTVMMFIIAVAVVYVLFLLARSSLRKRGAPPTQKSSF